MAQQTRMVATLVVLVVSMTGTSALLSWLDPSLPAGFNSLASCDIVGLAQDAVTQDVVVDTRRWHKIEVAPDRSRARATLLTAMPNKPLSIQAAGIHYGTGQAQSQEGRPQSAQTPRAHTPNGRKDSSRWHFRIAPNGRPIRGTSWRDQRKIGDAPNAIRIRLEATSSSGASITSAQWLCLRALVAAINESTGRESEPLTVVVGSRADRLTRQMLETNLR